MGMIIAFIGCVVQFASPIGFGHVFGPTDYMLGVENKASGRVEGFQKNPNALGVMFALYAVLLMFRPRLLKTRFMLIFAMLISLVIVVASGSRSALIFLVIGFGLAGFSKFKKFLTIAALVAIFVVTGLMDATYEKTASNVEHVQAVTDTKYIRWLMTYYGTVLAIENLPIGTGAGTFGSAFSHGSKVYDQVGLASLASVQEGRGVHDSNYGSIAGEFGVIGLAFFFGLTVFLVRRIFGGLSLRLKPRFDGDGRFALAMLTILMVSPFLRPLFSSSYYGVLVVLVIFAYKETAHKWRR